MQGYIGMHWDAKGYTGIHYIVAYIGIHRYTLGYAEKKWDTLGYIIGIHRDTLG